MLRRVKEYTDQTEIDIFSDDIREYLPAEFSEVIDEMDEEVNIENEDEISRDLR